MPLTLLPLNHPHTRPSVAARPMATLATPMKW